MPAQMLIRGGRLLASFRESTAATVWRKEATGFCSVGFSGSFPPAQYRIVKMELSKAGYATAIGIGLGPGKVGDEPKIAGSNEEILFCGISPLPHFSQHVIVLKGLSLGASIDC